MTTHKQSLFKKIPSVDRLLLSPGLKDISSSYPRSLVLNAIHQVLDELRIHIQKGKISKISELSLESVSVQVAERLKEISRPSLKPVINAAGVIVHTNLGRSILAESALKKFRPLAGGYSNLEYNLDQGKRGSRYTHVE